MVCSWRLVEKSVGVSLLLLFMLVFGSVEGKAVELCSPQSNELMRRAGINEGQIKKVCSLAKLTLAPFVISVHRTEEEMGYCRVTLSIQNRSTDYLNQLALTTGKSMFEIFQFHNVLPGTVGYASARSKILLGCDELEEHRLPIHWPASIRVADRAAHGQRLERYKPLFTGKYLHWVGENRREP